MTKGNLCVKLLIMVSLIGIIIGCKNGLINGQNEDLLNDSNFDQKINGIWTWAKVDGLIIKFHNGNFECFEDDFPFNKGTYITKDGNITIKVTHIHDDLYGPFLRWYTEHELEIILINSGKDTTLIKEELKFLFPQNTASYFLINENTLNIGSEVYFRKQ